MTKRIRLLVLASASLAALAVAAPSFAAYTPRLIVSPDRQLSGGSDRVLLAIEQNRTDNATAKISITVPAAFGLTLGQAPNTKIGTIDARILPQAQGGANATAVTVANVDVFVGNLADYAAAAAACGATPNAVWVATLRFLGTQLVVPMFVTKPAGLDGRIDICFRSPEVPEASGGAPLGARVLLADIFVNRGVFTNPAQSAVYMWRGVFTPYQPGTTTSLATSAVESQAFVPLPRGFVVKTKLAKNRRSVSFTGTLVWDGSRPTGARIALFAVQFRRGRFSGLKPAGSTRTKAGGKFTFRRPITKTTTFLLFALPAPVQCQTQTVAPGGCVNATVSDTLGVVTVKVPRKRKR